MYKDFVVTYRDSKGRETRREYHETDRDIRSTAGFFELSLGRIKSIETVKAPTKAA